MGEHEEWAQPSGLLPNGLLPNAGPLIRVFDSERWLKAEERTAELVACIQPNQPSEERRNAVADYVQRLIMKCFPCQVFTFGSVPLKTYLPDGDIDLTAFSNNQNLKDTWASEVRDMLENEEKNENAEFHVKEVQYIQAEVKIIKCLVENIVVDISFNQLGGLCTLCFLEEVDHLINQNHLFKRSIILIKAWCYYESRILGAHHGLISTYALETLVLYIFHLYNNSFAGPLEVLYRFLEFFSNFDWESFCVSLWGPVPISSLPDVTAEPPRKDSGELLLSKLFLDACSSVYAVFPSGQENQGQSFVSKHFNVIDPLRVNNNLGRSVSKGNFFRIRSAFAFGAKRLARLLDCPEESIVFEVNQFFLNTWDRHGSGLRPDAPRTEVLRLRLSTPDRPRGSENLKNSSSYKSQNSCGNLNSSRNSDQIVQRVSSNQVITHTDRGQRNFKPDNNLLNDIQGRFLFARTRSSPELTDTYGEVSSQGRCNQAPESGPLQADSNSGLNSYHHNRRKNLGSEISPTHSGRSSNDDPLNSGTNTYPRDSGLGSMSEELSSSLGMHQEEQDLVNMMASSGVHGFNGQVHMPMNLASGHLPFPISASILASMGYAQRNMGGMVPANIPLLDPSFSNMQFPHGLVSPPITHYFSGVGMTSNSEDSIDQGNANFVPAEMNSREADHEFWQGQDVNSTEGFDSENVNFERLYLDDKPQLSSSAGLYVPPSRAMRGQHKYAKEKRGYIRDDNQENIQENRGSEVHSDERTTSSRFSSAAHSRSKTPSESSWDEPSIKVSKLTKEKRGKKTVPAEPSVYGKGKLISEHVSSQSQEDDLDWNSIRNMGSETGERSSGTHSVASSHVTRHNLPGYEPAQTSGSDSMIPMGPMLLGPGTRQRMMDTSSGGVVPFAFYPTGPPVPFLTMLPVYNIPPGAGTSEATTTHYGGDESLDNSNSHKRFDSSEVIDQSEDLNTVNTTSDQQMLDILHSDFDSHWKNLQFGRFCQNPQPQGPMVYPSPVMVPPNYLQGRFPWDGPGRPIATNTNLFSQLMSYGPRIVPIAAPLQSVSNRPPNVYQRYVDDLPRYRSGTGTYLPNPKVTARDQHSSGNRRGNYNYDRSDNHGDREGNWYRNSKTRAAGRNHNRNQNDKSSTRLDRLTTGDNRADRSWNSYRHDTFPSYQSQTGGPLRPNSSHSGPPNASYSMYPVPAVNHPQSGLSSNGPNVPSVVMLYPYEHNNASSYSLHPPEQLEFGSIGRVGFSGMNEQSQISEGSQARGAFEEHMFHGVSAQRSSPDQPSSPHHPRRV
ncbi:hypothetical protein LguiA_010479 [Lonicera macranthoides]